LLKTQKEKESYVIGLLVGRDVVNKGVELNSDIFFKGFRDALAGAKPALSDADVQSTMEMLSREMTAKRQAEIAKASAENKKQEEAFMAENKKKEGVKTLSSGLQYKVLKEGNGPQPTLYDTVTVNYRGTLLNGTEFDSSYKRGQPATFPVNGVIRGWSEALQLMKTGSKWQLYVPARLAYGEAGTGGVIPPNAALIFEVELISIANNQGESKAAPKEARPQGGAGK
jgi:FKBP-type peptidyl-prolyl cis-trans isomerase FklB